MKFTDILKHESTYAPAISLKVDQGNEGQPEGCSIPGFM